MRQRLVVIPAVAAVVGMLAGWGLADHNVSEPIPVQAPVLAAEGSENNEAAQEEAQGSAAEEAEAAVPAATLTAGTLPNMGEVVTDSKGWILYRFDKDTANPPASNCVGECAEKWPPVLTGGDPKLNGIDSNLVGTVERKDGTQQVTLAGWPLYRFAGDEQPGQWKGQGLQSVWFVVNPDGTRNLSCLPDGVQAPGEEQAGEGGQATY